MGDLSFELLTTLFDGICDTHVEIRKPEGTKSLCRNIYRY